MNAVPVPMFVVVPVPVEKATSINQEREYHRDAYALGTMPAKPQASTPYGIECAAHAVALCHALGWPARKFGNASPRNHYSK